VKAPNELSATEAAAAIAGGSLRSTELVESCLARIDEREPVVKAWVNLDRPHVLAQARACDAAPARGPLHGVPVAIKDIIDTADLPTEYGSAIYPGHRPTIDAACVALVRRAGGIVMGKTVTTEFAAFQPNKTANPHNPQHTPGGSSSGSAAAVADFHVPLAFGTQTAGSITRPAAYCGVVGFKPTFGTYALAGIKPFAWSFDTLGTFSRTVEDAVLMWRVLQAAAPPPVSTLPKRPRLALCRTPFWDSAAPEARQAFDQASRALAGAGCELEEAVLPASFERLVDVHKLILEYEGARNLAFEAEPARIDKLSPSLRTMVENGFRQPAQRYLDAREAMRRAQQEFAALSGSWDVLMAPAAPGEAPRGLGATGDPLFSRMWTLLHVPVLNMTVAKGPTGLPVGVQFIGRHGGDLVLLELCRRFAEALA